jgi:hypothetical protein
VALDPAVARARFAVFVDRALEHARAAGLTDREIYRISGVASSTFHRWRTNQGRGLPELPKVRAFCEATGVSIDDAMAALGMTDAAPVATPEPPLPREVRIIMRRLTDPHVSEVEKDFIRRSLQMLAGQVSASERAEQKARDAG